MNPAEGSGNEARLPGAIQILHVLRGRGFHPHPAGQIVEPLRAIDANGVRTVILDHDQHRQNAQTIRIDLAESRVRLFVGEEGLAAIVTFSLV